MDNLEGCKKENKKVIIMPFYDAGLRRVMQLLSNKYENYFKRPTKQNKKQMFFFQV